MPIQVHCPNGCVLQLPANRAGRIVRCPQCKTTIQLRAVSESELASGQPIPIRAQRVNQQPKSTPRPLAIPEELTPQAIRKQQQREKEQLKKILATPPPPIEVKPVEVPPQKRRRRKKKKVIPPPATHFEPIDIQVDSGEKSPTHWEERVKQSSSDRVLLARFFAIGLCLIAAVNMVPACWFWYDWSQAVEPTQLPRWVYFQIGLAAIHLIYALFLWQIPDWSALRAVSAAMLVIAFVLGLMSTGLLVGGGGGTVATFFGISYSLSKRAAIWCVAMLCLATLICFLGGRESLRWERAEQLLANILTRNSLPTTQEPTTDA